MRIDHKIVAENQPTYFIADVAANHDGDLERAKDLVYLAAEAGADAIKFQHFNAKTIVSDYGFKKLGDQKSHQSRWKKSVYDVYDAASVDLMWTETLKKVCVDAGVSFFTTPYSLDLVDLLDDHVPAFKIGSGDINWLEMIEVVAKKGKPVFLATGASDLEEVKLAVNKCLQFNQQLCVMQCNTNYTGDVENFKYIQLNVLKKYKEIFPQCILGLSDHTPGFVTALGAVALGAKAIEKHFTDDIAREGPDHAFSMSPYAWREMVNRVRDLEASLGSMVKKVESNELETVVLQRRSLRATRHLKLGDRIQPGDFYPLRPRPLDAMEISPSARILGLSVTREIEEGDYLKEGDIE